MENTTEKSLPKNAIRSYEQFSSWCKENTKKISENSVFEFLKACKGGYPNGKEKSETSLKNKYREVLLVINKDEEKIAQVKNILEKLN